MNSIAMELFGISLTLAVISGLLIGPPYFTLHRSFERTPYTTVARVFTLVAFALAVWGTWLAYSLPHSH
jgi:hypothetical protein